MPGVVVFPLVTITFFVFLFLPCTDVNMMN